MQTTPETRVYNTINGKKETFSPLEPGRIGIYVCGITAYDYCHIGHARSALVFDMIVKYLRYRGFQVKYVRNFTDIDDKIIKRANERNTSCEVLSDEFIRAFHEDMAALGVAPADIEPKATEHVDDIISIIKDLIQRELAYPAGGDVYFRVTRFKEYGTLSGRDLDEMQAGARIEVNENKEHPMDFALWKASKPGEPTWESPWGPGRPGWHIECSAMSRKYLGDTFDFHGGGKDLIFPHHENELAQSVGASGKPFARYWLHHGFVTIKDEKMSKSLGNFLTIREVLERFHPEVLRLLVFSSHYRSPLDYSEAALDDAATGLDRLYQCLAAIKGIPKTKATETTIAQSDRERLEGLEGRFNEAMRDDFNSARALGIIFEVVKTINRIVQENKDGLPPQYLDLVSSTGKKITELATIMGLLTQEPDEYLRRKREEMLTGIDISAEKIENLIRERTEARALKDWSRSDAIRDQLLEHGIILKDGPEGTSWSVKKQT